MILSEQGIKFIDIGGHLLFKYSATSVSLTLVMLTKSLMLTKVSPLHSIGFCKII